MKADYRRRSHPHPKSDLAAHCQAVANHMKVILSTNLAPHFASVGYFLVKIIGLSHDLLKDTNAFQAHLDGAASSELSRHSGGGAVIGYLVAREILRQKQELFEKESIRALLPHIVFSVIAAHHGKLKPTDINKEHSPALKHWQNTRSNASQLLFEQMADEYEIGYDMCQLDQQLNLLREESFELDGPVNEICAEDFFCAFLLCKMCLGALSWADVNSAARQANGTPEPAIFETEINQSQFEVTPPKRDSNSRFNQLRTLFQDWVCENWKSDFPILLMKAPTGLGKTIAVSRLTARIHKKVGPTKVFYLAPTTAILNQVAEELFSFNQNSNNMLLHYLTSELTNGESDIPETQYNQEQIRARAKRFERLDAGLVVTTYHRALSVLGGMSKNTSLALLNLKNAVWILDECQFLSHIQFGVFALICSALHRLCNIFPVFMSATPPSQFLWQEAHVALHWFDPPKLTPLLTEQQLSHLEKSDFVDGRREIYPCPEILHIDQLLEKVQAYREEHPEYSILILVNLAKDAVEIFQGLKKVDYTITNYLRPKDIKHQLGEAAGRLKNNEPILMVATSIVQAGVDLDFDSGFVELNDLRSFRQGCGRVGRNFLAERGVCPVFAFDLRDNNLRSSWFRQRFHSMIYEEHGNEVKTIYKNIIEKSIAEVLHSPHPLLDSQIEAIEARYEKEIPRIFKSIENTMLGFPPGYDSLIKYNSGQGFFFEDIERFLTDDLNDNESASPFLVVYTEADANEYDKLMKLLSALQKISQQIDSEDPNFYELLKAYRNLKKDIFQYVALFSLKRRDVQIDFQENFKEKELYPELDFYLVLNPACYDAQTTGWQIDA
jgi:CRISPR-associated endonuclease Cas3-HD